MDRRRGLQQQVLELQCFHQIRVPDQRPVGDLHIGKRLEGAGQLVPALFESLARPEDGGIDLHGPLHLEADRRRRQRAVRVTQAVET